MVQHDSYLLYRHSSNCNEPDRCDQHHNTIIPYNRAGMNDITTSPGCVYKCPDSSATNIDGAQSHENEYCQGCRCLLTMSMYHIVTWCHGRLAILKNCPVLQLHAAQVFHIRLTSAQRCFHRRVDHIHFITVFLCAICMTHSIQDHNSCARGLESAG